MKNIKTIFQNYINYTKDKNNSLGMGHIWTANDLQLFLDKTDIRRIDTISRALIEFFMSLKRLETFEINCDYSKAQLLKISAIINAKTIETRKKRVHKLWYDYANKFLSGYEIRSAFYKKDQNILTILDYVDGWKKEDSKEMIIKKYYEGVK